MEDLFSGVRWRIFIFLTVLVPLGISTKFYHGVAAGWVEKYAGDIFYPIFWYFVILFFWPRFDARKNAAVVFTGSTLVEFTQLIHTPAIELIRKFFLGRVLLGSGFDGLDIIYYLLGSVISLLIYPLLFYKDLRRK